MSRTVNEYNDIRRIRVRETKYRLIDDKGQSHTVLAKNERDAEDKIRRRYRVKIQYIEQIGK